MTSTPLLPKSVSPGASPSTAGPVLLVAALVLLQGASPLLADTWNEGNKDAGDKLEEAKDVNGGTNRINGSIHTGGDCDIFCFNVGSSGDVLITISSSDFDPGIILFNAYGEAIAGDNDSGTDDDGEIDIDLDPGCYYLACGPETIFAYRSKSDYRDRTNDFFDSDRLTNPPNPTSERLYGVRSDNGSGSGSYRVDFDFDTTKPGGRADSRVGDRKKPGSHKGDNKYNKNGKKQRLTIEESAKDKGIVYFSLENDEGYPCPIKFEIKGFKPKNYKFKVYDVTKDRENITADVKKGAYYSAFAGRKLKNFCVELGPKKRKKDDRVTVEFDARSGKYRDVAICNFNFEGTKKN